MEKYMRYGYEVYRDLDFCGYYHKIKMMAEDLDQSLKIHKLRKEVKELNEKENKQAGAELCQAQPQAVIAGFPLASG